MLNSLIKILTSLKLTVICLTFGIILVFVGTYAQADEGLYQAQARYFKQWFVFPISFIGYKVPIALPGGYLIGTVLLINLTAAHIKRFQLSTKKLGIHLTHGGIILLLVGQLTTDIFSKETQMRFAEGETRDYSENGRDYELAVISDFNTDSNQVVAIPVSLLSQGKSLTHPLLPFKIEIKQYWPNSDLSFRAPMRSNAPPLAPQGIAQSFDFFERPITRSMEEKNVPTALLEFHSDPAQTPLGSWAVSGWSGDDGLNGAIWMSYARQIGRDSADRIVGQLTSPQEVTVDNKAYRFVLRPARSYLPYSMTLLETTHDKYPGTEIPKNFQSRVRIENPLTREEREVDIYMNNPLRYEGAAFFQYQMGIDELNASRGTSTLQVMRNPSWLAPYIGCIVVGVGLIYQFMLHLTAFIKRRSAS